MKKERLLEYYPMIHKDKMVYMYDKRIRIGTDDNDVIEVNQNSEQWLCLLKMLDGEHSIKNILLRFKWLTFTYLSYVIVKLAQKGSLSILETPFTKLCNNGSDSDLTYYYSEGLDGITVLKKLSALRISIFGVGGGGSLLALQLANIGVKNIHIVDPDIIDQTNINRQFLFKKSDIGKSKVDIVKSFLINRHNDIHVSVSKKKITTVSDAMKEIGNSNWSFCCMDEPPYIAQRIINRASYLKNIPSLYGFSSRDSAKLLIVSPNQSGCIDCLLDSQNTSSFRKLIVSFQKSNFNPVTPIILPTMLLETSWMAKRWLDQVLERKNMGDVLYRFDYNMMKEERFIKFHRNPYCPTCGNKKDEDNLWKIIPIG